MAITAQQYAQQNNLPEWIETWEEVTELTGKSFADITLELAESITTVEVLNPIKIKAKVAPIPQPAAGSLESIIAAAVAPYMANNTPAIDEDAVIELIKQYAPIKHIEVNSNNGMHKVSGAQHNMFEEILTVLSADIHIYLYGPAGTGKTQCAENAALALGKKFACVSVCAQSTKSDLLGFIDANGNYIRTLFRDTFENGGVFLIDEIDNGNPNILAVLNSALANGYCAFPDGMVKRSDEFTCIAAANTFGTGADRQYVGRNQLDAATLNRFVQIEVGYDEQLEVTLFGDTAKKIQKIRKEYAGTNAIISMRNIGNVCKLIGKGVTEVKAIQIAVYNTISKNILKVK
ncbi:AAA family ATPase [Mucilaginibacter sp.]|uniref:AAA family ATPase n=1 Tax=Mucilaginibacter sp. TaxID=1882438 RepID=UPI00374CAB68